MPERRIQRHGTRLASVHEAALDTQFPVGTRVVTPEGITGRVLFVDDSFTPGNTAYQVQLDNGMGGGTYLASQLRAVPAGFKGAPGYSNLPAGLKNKTPQDRFAQGVMDRYHHGSLDEVEADLDSHLASDDYPEMGSILHDRPDPATQFRVIGSLQKVSETWSTEWNQHYVPHDLPKLYHGTNVQLGEGHYIEPGHPTNYEGAYDGMEEEALQRVHATPHLHRAWQHADNAVHERGGQHHVYEVEPTGGHVTWGDETFPEDFDDDEDMHRNGDRMSESPFKVVRELPYAGEPLPFTRRHQAAADGVYDVHPDEIGFLGARDYYNTPLRNRPWEHGNDPEGFQRRVREIMESARDEGIREPVRVMNSVMHDGAHRWEAARQLGIQLPIQHIGSLHEATEIYGVPIDDQGDAPEHGLIPRAADPNDYDHESTEGNQDPEQNDDPGMKHQNQPSQSGNVGADGIQGSDSGDAVGAGSIGGSGPAGGAVVAAMHGDPLIEHMIHYHGAYPDEHQNEESLSYQHDHEHKNMGLEEMHQVSPFPAHTHHDLLQPWEDRYDAPHPAESAPRPGTDWGDYRPEHNEVATGYQHEHPEERGRGPLSSTLSSLHEGKVPWTPQERDLLHKYPFPTATYGDFVPSYNFQDANQHRQHAGIEETPDEDELEGGMGARAEAVRIHKAAGMRREAIDWRSPEDEHQHHLAREHGWGNENFRRVQQRGDRLADIHESLHETGMANHQHDDFAMEQGRHQNYARERELTERFGKPGVLPASPPSSDPSRGGHYEHMSPERLIGTEEGVSEDVQNAMNGTFPKHLLSSLETGPRAFLEHVIGVGRNVGDEVYKQLSKDYPPEAIDWVNGVKWSGPEHVPLDKIDWANKHEWAASHEPDRVAKFEKKIKKKIGNGDHAKPMIGVARPDANNVMIADGHHRGLAYEHLDQPAWGYVAHPDMDEGPWDEMHAQQLPAAESGDEFGDDGGKDETGSDQKHSAPLDKQEDSGKPGGAPGQPPVDGMAPAFSGPPLTQAHDQGHKDHLQAMQAWETAQSGGGGGEDPDDPDSGDDPGNPVKKDKAKKAAALFAFEAAADSPSFAFHFTARWSDVVAKARRIRENGGVRITASTGGLVVGQVRGDHDVYESGIQRQPGKPRSIQHWACGCPWASWHQDKSYPGRLNGRPCSHVWALQLEATARQSSNESRGITRTDPAISMPYSEVVVKSLGPWTNGGWAQTWTAPSTHYPVTSGRHSTPEDLAFDDGLRRREQDSREGKDDGWQDDAGYYDVPGEENLWLPVHEAASILKQAGVSGDEVETLIILTADQANAPWGGQSVPKEQPQPTYGATEPPQPDMDPAQYGFLNAPDPENWGSIDDTSATQMPMHTDGGLHQALYAEDGERDTCQNCKQTVRRTTMDESVPWVHEHSGNSYCDVQDPGDAVGLSAMRGEGFEAPEAKPMMFEGARHQATQDEARDWNWTPEERDEWEREHSHTAGATDVMVSPTAISPAPQNESGMAQWHEDQGSFPYVDHDSTAGPSTSMNARDPQGIRMEEAISYSDDMPRERWRQLPKHHQNAILANEARDQIHPELAASGHDMEWQHASGWAQKGHAQSWEGNCRNCGANVIVGSWGSSVHSMGRDAREGQCAGPGTKWQNDMLIEHRHQKINEAVSEYGREMKGIHDREKASDSDWLGGIGIEGALQRALREVTGLELNEGAVWRTDRTKYLDEHHGDPGVMPMPVVPKGHESGDEPEHPAGCNCTACEYNRYHARHGREVYADLSQEAPQLMGGLGAELHDKPEGALDEDGLTAGDTPMGGGDAGAGTMSPAAEDVASLGEFGAAKRAAVRERLGFGQAPQYQANPAGHFPLDPGASGGGPGMSQDDEDLTPNDQSIQTMGQQQWSGGGADSDEVEVPAGDASGSEQAIVAAFQASAAARNFSGGGASAAADGDIAAMARRFLKTGTVSDAEASELIAEGKGTRARNLDLLDLEGTHYEAEAAAMDKRGLSLDDFDDDLVTI